MNERIFTICSNGKVELNNGTTYAQIRSFGEFNLNGGNLFGDLDCEGNFSILPSFNGNMKGIVQFGSHSRLFITLDTNLTQSGLLVTGTTTLNGAVRVESSSSLILDKSQKKALITASDGVSGTFQTLLLYQIEPGLGCSLQLEYEPKRVLLACLPPKQASSESSHVHPAFAVLVAFAVAAGAIFVFIGGGILVRTYWLRSKNRLLGFRRLTNGKEDLGLNEFHYSWS